MICPEWHLRQWDLPWFHAKGRSTLAVVVASGIIRPPVRHQIIQKTKELIAVGSEHFPHALYANAQVTSFCHSRSTASCMIPSSAFHQLSPIWRDTANFRSLSVSQLRAMQILLSTSTTPVLIETVERLLFFGNSRAEGESEDEICFLSCRIHDVSSGQR